MNRDSTSFLSSLSQAARDNPMAAAMIGGGVLWLMFGNRPLDATFSSMASTAQPLARSGVRGASTAIEAATTAGQQAADEVAETTRSTIRSAGEAAASGSATVQERMSEPLYRTTDAATRATDSNRGAADALRPSSAPLSQLHKGYASTRSGLAYLFERQPLVLGALGLAIGAGVASAAASTEFESKWAGSLSDEAKDTVRSRADHVAETAQRAAGEFGSEFRAAASEAADTLRKAGEQATHALGEKDESGRA